MCIIMRVYTSSANETQHHKVVLISTVEATLRYGHPSMGQAKTADTKLQCAKQTLLH